MDYKDTINLPKTSFPMKAKLPQKEPDLLKRWQEMDLYHTITRKHQGKAPFILHDGPPYANGHIHIGTALNKILKDIIIKSKFMAGYKTAYIPGWDCHGLPVEHNVEKKLGKKKHELSAVDIRKKCREYAGRFVDIQRDEFKRLGVLGDWDSPYLTMNNSYTATIVREFAAFADSGNLYKRKKPIQWCASCRTALAEAEVEYHDESSPSIFVMFPLLAGEAQKIPELQAEKDPQILIWTTTPWTIPANLAVCVNPDFDYVAVKAGGKTLVLAEGLVHKTMITCGIEDFIITERFSGSALEGLRYRHPLYDRACPVILGTHVTLDAGTGCVHTAPGHGQEDYQVGLQYGLDVYAPVDDAGRFTKDASDLEGTFVFAANEEIQSRLSACGALLHAEEVTHSYPHCWRCKKPVIFRATDQWFVSMEHNGLRARALRTIENTRWIPRWGVDRIRGMVENRPDWCLSRQRSWGVPIVAFYCAQCGAVLVDGNIIRHVAGLFEQEGSDIWFDRDAKDLLPEGAACPVCGASSFTKETDILDVWFDSGVSHAAVLESRSELQSPCDMYLEGSDQHRGWFQSSLLTSVCTRDRAPYGCVLTHGFVVDGRGEKMAKSKGNVISPDDIIKQYGAELLRLWVVSENYQEDMRISPDILKRLSEAYRKIRNTWRFMLGNLNDYNPETDALPYEKLEEIDKWALHRLNMLIRRVRSAYDSCEFHTIYHSTLNFCINDMSAVYLDILKDRLYCSAADDPGRRSGQAVLHTVLSSLLKLLAPILSFTAEEAWQHLPDAAEESVHLAGFPEPDSSYDNTQIEQNWRMLLAVREQVLKELERAREQKQIGNSLEAAVHLSMPENIHSAIAPYEAMLPDICIVSSISIAADSKKGEGALDSLSESLDVSIARADGKKCQRCWKYYREPEPELCPRCSRAAATYHAC